MSKRRDHPPCHVFAVSNDGKEYLLDVSFKKVEIDGERLLDLAAADAENRGRAMNFFLKIPENILKAFSRKWRHI